VRYVIVADFWADDFAGGGGKHSGGAELSDEILFNIFQNRNEDVIKRKSSEVTNDFLEEERDSTFILSNFFQLHPFLLEKIESLRYILYCHDYKFVGHMQPQKYEDFIVPKEELIFLSLFENASAVICQSSLQESIHRDNLGASNLINFSGNLWAHEDLDLMQSLGNGEKKEICSVVKSPYLEKGVPEAIKFCIKERLDYELISDKDYRKFLHKLGGNKGLVFWSLLPETCGRIVVEAKMMGVNVRTNSLLGASHEPWFNLQGKELVDIMRNKHDEIHEIICNIEHK
jgi:hypothetical protein